MKIIIRTLSITGLLVMSLPVSSRHPVVSTKYSDDQIETQIRSYRASNAHDVLYPSGALSQQFKKDFPLARDIEWETAAGIYEAEFEIRQREYKAFYDAVGNLLMYAFEIRLSEVPSEIRDTARSKYVGFKFDRAAKKTVMGTKVFYRVTVERGETEIEATFDSGGSFVKSQYD